ncbi:cytochrome P450 [Actinomadura xylanilytica]|uniref:cytochrome P450 n=1 Tax=Actinomadura xylanilytica TaxID=887459 RepID=UPI00255AB4C2|nr:cytochrome P450 [Actinomadura xylanilytica]MDL4777833.1 cytochrome P450 [Actinomadura xylanilytica]
MTTDPAAVPPSAPATELEPEPGPGPDAAPGTGPAGGSGPGSGGTGRPRMYGPAFDAAPDRFYAELRERGPVAPVELAPGVPATLVIGYDAALEVLRDPGTFPKDARRWERTVAPDCPVLPMMMYRPNCLLTDGGVHARLRAAVTDSLARLDPFTLREHVERNGDALIDAFAADGAADLAAQYARVLPLLIFNEMFGCPAEIGDRLVFGMSGIFDGVEAEKANAVLGEAVLDLVALKRRSPGADVASWMLGHPVGLTDEEMAHQLILLLGAGTEPEQNLITNGIRLLLSDDRFAGDLSGGSLPVEEALDEILWTDPPMANYAVTYPVRDLDFAGVRLPADQPVVISFAAANTDPARAGGDRSGAYRAGNRAHLAWSAGPHTCPAKNPARLIAIVAIERVLDRLPDLELAVPAGGLVWRPGPFHRALAELPVRFPPAPRAPAGPAAARPPR